MTDTAQFQPHPPPEIPDPVSCFRERVGQAAVRHPDLPQREVVLSRLFAYVYLRMEAAFDALTSRWGLSAWAWFTLMAIYAREGEDVTPSDISRVLFLPRANVTRLTDDLVRRELLHRVPSTTDRRVLLLTLTDAGRTLVLETMPHTWELHRAVWGGLSSDQLDGAEDLFRTILGGISAAPIAVPPEER